MLYLMLAPCLEIPVISLRIGNRTGLSAIPKLPDASIRLKAL